MNQHTKPIITRGTEEEHKEIKIAATKAGMSLKDYIRKKLGLDYEKDGKKK